MPEAVPACFRGGAAGGPPPSTAAGPSLTTSVYETHLGLAALSWSRTVLGLSLRAVLRLSGDDEDEEEEEEELLRFRIRPWLLWKRRGTRRFHLKNHPRHRCVDFAWDLARASFPPGGGPEPAAGFFVAVSVDGEMLLVAGDLADEAYKKSKVQRPQTPLLSSPALISRREHVMLDDHGGRRSYLTRAPLGGRDREISIELGAKEKGREVAMSVGIDGERVLQVRRLRWKFRGSETVEVGGGVGRIQVSWDLHNWFFQSKDDATASPPAAGAAELGHAVFVLRFEGEEQRKQQAEGHSGKGIGKEEGHLRNAMCKSPAARGYNGKNRNGNWNETSGGGVDKRRGRKSSLRKTSSSSSSTSSVSSASTSTVMEWASAEEVELQRAHGFSLLVYACKS
ncbi:hypothetical protein C4D60_Mb03t04380 [Musa balbisiana]|uniref:DUF868 domain-containing protein n=1 Tax=Musa balbisiana TaxID=52838 RepID=A0A4S8J8J2_MUSBA|nr:hypothetical protein C4D60_Mb03t04380 [Musa balbisiana]